MPSVPMGSTAIRSWLPQSTNVPSPRARWPNTFTPTGPRRIPRGSKTTSPNMRSTNLNRTLTATGRRFPLAGSTTSFATFIPPKKGSESPGLHPRASISPLPFAEKLARDTPTPISALPRDASTWSPKPPTITSAPGHGWKKWRLGWESTRTKTAKSTSGPSGRKPRKTMITSKASPSRSRRPPPNSIFRSYRQASAFRLSLG